MSARTGKIARLPVKLREELNQRLLDGQSAGKILPWLNTHPTVKRILDEDFEGLLINDNNLSAWRDGGFADWQRQRGRIDRTRELARYAAEQSRAGGASIADGAAAIASGQLLELLEVMDEATEGDAGKTEDGQPKRFSPDGLLKIAAALSSLRNTEQTDVKLAIQKKQLKQKDRQIDLDEQIFRRETCELFLKWHAARNALDVANSDSSNADKIERLGQLMFPGTWKPVIPGRGSAAAA